MMRSRISFSRRGLYLAAISVAIFSTLQTNSWADRAEGSGSGNGSASASGTGTGTTGASANGSGQSRSSANNTDSGDQAGASSQSNGQASATGTSGNSSLSANLAASTAAAAVKNNDDKAASAAGAVAGTVGSTSLTGTVSASATATPDQLTASAAGSDGSAAYAALGAITSFYTFVPSGLTQLTATGSVSCNASGSCSFASIANNSVFASVKMVAASMGGAEAVLRAVLEAEAGASSAKIYATATASITGSGRTSTVAVWGNANATSDARIFKVVTASGGTATGKVWVSGDKICASTSVKLTHGKKKLQRLVTCKVLKKRPAVVHRTILDWFSPTPHHDRKVNARMHHHKTKTAFHKPMKAKHVKRLKHKTHKIAGLPTRTMAN